LKQFLVIILFFLVFLSTVFLNVKVSALKSEIAKINREIDNLEKEKVYLETKIQSSLSIKNIETKAQKLGLTYPKNVVEIKVYNGSVAEVIREKYYAASLEQ